MPLMSNATGGVLLVDYVTGATGYSKCPINTVVRYTETPGEDRSLDTLLSAIVSAAHALFYCSDRDSIHPPNDSLILVQYCAIEMLFLTYLLLNTAGYFR